MEITINYYGQAVSVSGEKFLADGLNAQPHSLFRASAHFPNLGTVKIIQCIEQEPLPLGVSTQGQTTKRRTLPMNSGGIGTGASVTNT